jgi:hypothetical protein
MKVNEAPEKIYLSENPCRDELEDVWFKNQYSKNDIEYIRKDAFIEKACEWFKSHGSFTIGFDGATIREFLNFINK